MPWHIFFVIRSTGIGIFASTFRGLIVHHSGGAELGEKCCYFHFRFRGKIVKIFKMNIFLMFVCLYGVIFEGQYFCILHRSTD